MEDNSETLPIHQEKNSDSDDDQKNVTFNYRKCCLMICIVILILILWFRGDYFRIDDNNHSDYNMTSDIYDLPDIEASLHFHNNHHGLKCQNYDYGCCEIYHSCESKNTYLDSSISYLSPYRIHSIDILNSNCPSLDEIVHQYNQVYKDKYDCSLSKYGCCPPINTGCDHTFREIDGNNELMVQSYENDYQLRKHTIKVAKSDNRGSNCDDFYGVLNKYDDSFPVESDPISGLITILIMFGIGLCLFG